jgi:hypothetical protein
VEVDRLPHGDGCGQGVAGGRFHRHLAKRLADGFEAPALVAVTNAVPHQEDCDPGGLAGCRLQKTLGHLPLTPGGVDGVHRFLQAGQSIGHLLRVGLLGRLEGELTDQPLEIVPQVIDMAFDQLLEPRVQLVVDQPVHFCPSVSPCRI